jgi:hypothetical protein
MIKELQGICRKHIELVYANISKKHPVYNNKNLKMIFPFLQKFQGVVSVDRNTQFVYSNPEER